MTSSVRAIGYVRCSDARNLDKTESPQEQADNIKKLCDLRGWELVDIIEEGGSAKESAELPRRQALLARVLTGEADIVVCYRFDRVSRDTVEGGQIVKLLRDAGKHLASATEPIDTLSDYGEIFVKLLFVFAEMDRKNIVKRNQAGLRRFREAGGFAGQPPFGFKLQEGKFVPNGREYVSLMRIYLWRAQGKGARQICKLLNQENGKSITDSRRSPYPTRGGIKEAKVAIWHLKQVERVLAGIDAYPEARAAYNLSEKSCLETIKNLVNNQLSAENRLQMQQEAEERFLKQFSDAG